MRAGKVVGKNWEKLGTDGTFTNFHSSNNWGTFRLSRFPVPVSRPGFPSRFPVPVSRPGFRPRFPRAQSSQLALHAEAGRFLRGVHHPRERVVPNSGAGAGEWRSFEEGADAMPSGARGEKSVSVRGLPGSVGLAAREAGEEEAPLTADWHAPSQAKGRLE